MLVLNIMGFRGDFGLQEVEMVDPVNFALGVESDFCQKLNKKLDSRVPTTNQIVEHHETIISSFSRQELDDLVKIYKR